MTPTNLRKKIVAAGATLALSAAGIAATAQPAAAQPSVTPGSTVAGMTYTAGVLSGSGTTNGWSKGHIYIHGYRYQPNGALDGQYDNDCTNSTYCTLPTWAFCPVVPGTWRWVVRGSGPGGSASDSSYAVVVF
ncbi:hypothetical protein [Micromonospora sp. WMMD980]|uniref:hypothetical protein n=1 Tax=Micromonospora sp. WMMD980 TaxID=3016088 RepID=UPI002417EF1C|nr:hypothetical protein [Micromonospora sp. WMMD980]MDG4801698.1 hypothetical protein [Micromonospora sp. WMMD980]